MTKYLIIALVGLIIITALVLFFTPSRPQAPITAPSSAPRASAPGSIPNPSLSTITPLPSDTYQEQADKNYADLQKKQDEEYPWLEQMPLQTTSYFVYFEISSNTFTAKIYDKSREEQLKQEILQRLNSLNIDVTKYKIVWE